MLYVLVFSIDTLVYYNENKFKFLFLLPMFSS